MLVTIESSCIKDQFYASAARARQLLAATGVASVAGSAFFRPGRGENLLRFCFAKQDAELDEACERLRKG